jgi:hypothetical protein
MSAAQQSAEGKIPEPKVYSFPDDGAAVTVWLTDITARAKPGLPVVVMEGPLTVPPLSDPFCV